MATPTHYDTLQVHPQASAAVIKAAYKALAQQFHPDRNKEPGATARFQAIAQAYETLSEPSRRKAYDERLAAQRPSSGQTQEHRPPPPSAAPRPSPPAPPPQTPRPTAPPSPPPRPAAAPPAFLRNVSVSPYWGMGIAAVVAFLLFRAMPNPPSSAAPVPAAEPLSPSSLVTAPPARVTNAEALVRVDVQALSPSRQLPVRDVEEAPAPPAALAATGPTSSRASPRDRWPPDAAQSDAMFKWLDAREARWTEAIRDSAPRLLLLSSVWTEAQRAKLDPDLVLAVVEAVSLVSDGTRPADRFGPIGISSHRLRQMNVDPNQFSSIHDQVRLGGMLLSHDLQYAGGRVDAAVRAYFSDWPNAASRAVQTLEHMSSHRTHSSISKP